MEMDISPHQINYVLGCYIDKIRHTCMNIEINDRNIKDFHNENILLGYGKKNQLIEQIIFEAMSHFTTGGWKKKAYRVVGDLLYDLSDEDGSRKLYDTLMQDSHRR